MLNPKQLEELMDARYAWFYGPIAEKPALYRRYEALARLAVIEGMTPFDFQRALNAEFARYREERRLREQQ